MVESATQSVEMSLWEALRAHFEGRGYRFIKDPKPECLPEFLEGFRPDALAQKPGDNVIIELKSRRTRASDILERDLRNRLENGWSLNVIYAADKRSDEPIIPVANRPTLEREIAEIKFLMSGGHGRAAFVLTWSLLEAAYNRIGDAESGRPRSVGQLVQSLAMLGFIDKDEERRLRELLRLRSIVVHGGLDAKIEEEAVAFVLEVADRVLHLDQTMSQPLT